MNRRHHEPRAEYAAERALLRDKLDRVKAPLSPEIRKALLFVIGFEGGDLKNFEIVKARVNTKYLLERLEKVASLENVDLDVLRKIGLGRTDTFGIDEVKALLQATKKDGTRLGELNFYIQEPLLPFWDTGNELPIVKDKRYSLVRVTREQDLDLLEEHRKKLAPAARALKKDPHIWDFSLAKSIQRNQLDQPAACDIQAAWPEGVTVNDPVVRARIGNVARTSEGPSVLEVNLAQSMFGTEIANALRAPMKALGLRAANESGWNIYF